MKSSKIIIIILLGIICFYTPKILAIKEITFPDSNAVQPIPDNSLPNISGNIDWPNNPQDQNTATSTANSAINQNNPSNVAANPNTDSSNTADNPNVSSNDALNGNSQNSGAAGPASKNPSTNQPTVGQPSPNNRQKFDPSNPFSYFDTIQSQKNNRTENTSVENNKIPDNSSSNQNSDSSQDTSSQSSYIWIIILSSITILVAVFMIWKSKK